MDNEEPKKSGNAAMLKICGFIVDKRNLFFLLFGLLMIFSVIARSWVNVENVISYYLPESTETKQGLELMDEEFTTYGTCKVMIANVSFEQADKIRSQIENIDGVFSVDFDDSEDHYNNGSALYGVTFDYDEDDEECLTPLNDLKQQLSGYDMYLTTSLGDTQSELIAQEMGVISIIVAVIVVTVLLLTSQAYAEVPVLLLTFGSS
ncbi:MAG TPA: RND transporter, partial [Lachnospiraceae bacterium]|nr:RND transporter [Lachnospiraceae bacterium]